MDTLGIVECRTIAFGALLADNMIKAAPVDLVRAATICSGRYLIMVSGDQGAVNASIDTARSSGRSLVGVFVLSNVSDSVLSALKKGAAWEDGEALAVVEARTASSGVAAADAAVKRAPVRLLRLVTGQGITGKSYFVLAGDVASVEEGASAAAELLGRQLLDSVIIPSPSKPLAMALTGR